MYYFRQPLVQPVFIHTIFELYLKSDFINTVQRPHLFNERRDTSRFFRHGLPSWANKVCFTSSDE